MNNQQNKDIALWLSFCTVLIYGMVIIGGLTRLTDSGLSMVDWRPVLGWIPPMSLAEWEEVFARYQHSPQFKIVNHDMDLSGFKSIFWLEYIHRLLGRIIGVVFLLPLLYFIVRKRIHGRLAFGLSGIFALGAIQGVIGWIMVQSGLVDTPQVSPYRLTLHLGFAVMIYAIILWLALTAFNAPVGTHDSCKKLTIPTILLGMLIFVTILSGGLVAGLDAGLIFNTFPLMDGRFIPAEYMDYQPIHRAFFEHIPTVQWDHRVLALSVFSGVVLLWIALHRQIPQGTTQTIAHGLLFMAMVQVGLGIATLLLAVPIPLASMHQGGALLLFTLNLVLVHRLVYRQV